MCISRGCTDPYDDHGDRRNITQQDIEEAARVARTGTTQIAQNILNAQYYPSDSFSNSEDERR